MQSQHPIIILGGTGRAGRAIAALLLEHTTVLAVSDAYAPLMEQNPHIFPIALVPQWRFDDEHASMSD